MKTLSNGVTLVRASEVAQSAGVHSESVASWAKRHKFKRKHGLYNYLSMDAATTYARLHGVERVLKKPKGWWTIKGMILECGVGRQPIKEAIEEGQLRAVTYHRSFYVHPEDAKRFMLAYTSDRPLPGWVMVPDLRRELKRSKEALNQWIRRNDIRVRKFLHPTRNRVTPYISVADAERYRQVVSVRGDRHVGYTWRTGARTNQRIIDLLHDQGGAPMTSVDIAAALDISQNTINHAVVKLYREGALARTGRGVKNDLYRYQLTQHGRSVATQAKR